WPQIDPVGHVLIDGEGGPDGGVVEQVAGVVVGPADEEGAVVHDDPLVDGRAEGVQRGLGHAQGGGREFGGHRSSWPHAACVWAGRRTRKLRVATGRITGSPRTGSVLRASAAAQSGTNSNRPRPPGRRG